LFKTIKNSSKYIVSLSIVALLSACGSGGNEGANNVSGSAQLVGATVVDDVPASTMLAVIHASIDANATNAFGYKAVKIRYNTVSQDGTAVIASGLLVIPTPTDAYKAYLSSLGKAFSVSMINENHGTIFLNSEAPTQKEVTNGLPDYATAIAMSGVAGFAAIIPDYIGFGDSNDSVVPYILEKSAARSSVDMIKASIKYMEDSGVVLNYQLYITGYSQGGYNAMATAKSIENGAITNVNLMGVAPMAGPYNVEDLANIELKATHTMAFPAFLADLGYSYSHYYSDVNLSDIAVPSLGQFQTAFNGSNDTVPIHVILGLANGTTDFGFYTHTTDELFQSAFISDYQNNQNNIMRQKFVENSLDNWTPQSKMNLIQCVDDDIIPFSEAQNTYNKFLANGADVTLTPIPTSIIEAPSASNPFVHGRCGRTAYSVAVKWFADIRSGAIQ
jgi:predicted esterase